MNATTKTDNNEILDELRGKVEYLLTQYRLKSDELKWAEEEWDIGEIHESLSAYKKKIELLKKKIHAYEQASA